MKQKNEEEKNKIIKRSKELFNLERDEYNKLIMEFGEKYYALRKIIRNDCEKLTGHEFPYSGAPCELCLSGYSKSE